MAVKPSLKIIGLSCYRLPRHYLVAGTGINSPGRRHSIVVSELVLHDSPGNFFHSPIRAEVRFDIPVDRIGPCRCCDKPVVIVTQRTVVTGRRRAIDHSQLFQHFFVQLRLFRISKRIAPFADFAERDGLVAGLANNGRHHDANKTNTCHNPAGRCHQISRRPAFYPITGSMSFHQILHQLLKPKQDATMQYRRYWKSNPDGYKSPWVKYGKNRLQCRLSGPMA